ncbi:type II glyceraldehyde-3-phosphate dehydrogenase [Ramlibacter sp. PS3R-8]|uniref:type II glyceraldehyde-3-phosphate dehydrogenase n=1 Tax=Ramlibacter sp. PS3R-8 TaxID=3133437 RepID=UPI0030AEFCB4
MNAQNSLLVRVAVVGYGVIGKRVADAVARQTDMRLVGVADVQSDWRVKAAGQRGHALYAGNPDALEQMRERGLEVQGTLDTLLRQADVVVDCTPKKVAAGNVEMYRQAGLRYVLQGGEKHEAAGHSFVAEANYVSALGRRATRVVSCNTTSIVRTLGALRDAGLLHSARGTLLRRATDPVDSHVGGMINTMVPETKVPSHQGPDARTVLPDLDLVTMAVAVPENLAHVHSWSVRLTRSTSREQVLEAFARSSRIALLRADDGLGAINVVKEWMADLGRSRADLYEVGLWEDLVTVQGDEVFFNYMVDNQAIVIPETIDAIRALSGHQPDAGSSIAATDESLGIPLLRRA